VDFQFGGLLARKRRRVIGRGKGGVSKRGVDRLLPGRLVGFPPHQQVLVANCVSTPKFREEGPIALVMSAMGCGPLWLRQ
jgi:hypothetical protein